MAMLGGVSEVVERIGVSRQRLADIRIRPDFPVPVAELSNGPIWDLAEIDRWLASGVRRGPGRPSATERLIGGRFALDPEPLGSGGFADVYRATDRRTGDVVAVKILKNIGAVDAEAVIRFRRELRLMEEELDHPHVAKVIAHGDFSGTDEIWCAMPLAIGSLQDEIAGMAGDLAAVTDLARQLCAGVGHVHGRKILHRDLKPGNILRSAEGLWQVSDFGLAREEERKSQAQTTTLAQGMGTYFYASPEQWARPKHADVRDDIFAIGKILQYAVTGEMPLVSADQMTETPLRSVIQRATGPRSGRYPSTAALMAAIEQALAAYSTTWEDPGSRLERLRPRLGGMVVDQVAASELLNWLQADNIDDEIQHAAAAFIATAPATLQWMWSANPTAFRSGYGEVVSWVKFESFPFAYCDAIANTVRNVLAVARDNDVLRSSITSLGRLGAGHSRWHVRDVLLEILQSIRTTEEAVVALEALQDLSGPEVAWCVPEFAARAMHPTLRLGLEKLRTLASA